MIYLNLEFFNRGEPRRYFASASDCSSCIMPGSRSSGQGKSPGAFSNIGQLYTARNAVSIAIVKVSALETNISCFIFEGRGKSRSQMKKKSMDMRS